MDSTCTADVFLKPTMKNSLALSKCTWAVTFAFCPVENVCLSVWEVAVRILFWALELVS